MDHLFYSWKKGIYFLKKFIVGRKEFIYIKISIYISVWLGFFLVWLGLFSGFFRFGFGFFGFRLIKSKPNRTGRIFQNFNLFNRFFSLFGFFSYFFSGFLSFWIFCSSLENIYIFPLDFKGKNPNFKTSF
jgi:hypothetical protein